MLLGCNYSRELIQLLREKRTEVDYIKLALHEVCREGFEVSRGFGPVLVHPINLGVVERTGMKESDIELIDWQRINGDLAHYNSPHFGLHLDVRKSDWGEPEIEDEAIIQHVIKIAQSWARRVKVPFLLENVPYSDYYGENAGTFEVVTRPKVIKEICIEANVGLLLDLSHARVTAWYRNEKILDYLAQLPLERIREIHVVGAKMTEQGLRDRHMEMEEEDYQALEWLLERTHPHIVTLEYGGVGPIFEFRSDLLILERQLKRLREICNRY